MNSMSQVSLSKLDILLSTYNGCLYLEELISSLLRQSNSEWNLIIRDDQSSDDSANLVLCLTREIKNRVDIIETGASRLGPSKSFSKLLESSRAFYSMFCDQDDIWLQNKIDITLQAMHQLESKFGKEKPLLVHTDLAVINEFMQPIASSFWHYQNLDPESSQLLNRLLVQNVATGCTILINEPLRKLALPIPDSAVMHDWWLALVACTFGHIGYVSTPTILYRQHGLNDTGAQKWGANYLFERVRKFYRVQEYISKTIYQAEIFLQRYENVLDEFQLEVIEKYINLRHENLVARKVDSLKYGFYEAGSLRNLGFFLAI